MLLEQSMFERFSFFRYPRIPIPEDTLSRIMEKADNVYVWLSTFTWSDLGSWGSLFDNSQKDANNNVVNAETLTYDTRNSVIKASPGKLIVAQGLNGYLIGAFDNVVIVCEKDKEELFRRVVNDLKSKPNGNEFL